MITPQLLEALLSPNAGVRSQAETVYQSMSVVERVQGLLHQLTLTSQSPPQSLQLLTAVLLRRDILKLTDPNLLQQLLSPLLTAFNSSSCRLQVGHCLAEVCASLSMVAGNSNVVEHQVLPTILSSMEASLQQSDVISLKLLATLADRSPVAFTQVAVASLPQLLAPTSSSSSQVMEAWTEVLVNAAVATTIQNVALVQTAPTSDELVVDERSAAASLGNSCLGTVLSWMVSSNDPDAVQACLQHLSHAAVNCPSLLAGTTPVLESCVATCLEMATTKHPSDVRLAALQVLASLVSVGDVKRRVLSASMASTMASTVLPLCAQLLAEGMQDENVQEWASEPATLVEAGMDNDSDQFLFAESLAEAFLQHLKNALSVALPLVQQLLESQDWKHASAGLALLECALTAAPVSLAPHIPVVVQAASSLATSTNVRVQWQAIRLLGALCETSSSIEASPQVVLERLAGALGSPCTKVSAMACLGLVSNCRAGDDSSQQILPFLPDLLAALVQGPLSLDGTDTGSVTVRVRAMGATACLAESVGDAFSSYYPTIMPGLLASAQLPMVELAGAAVEAATIVGQAVGKELFQADAQRLLSWILPALQTETPSLEQLLMACARIASVLAEDFLPYVDSVLPHLLRRAQAPPDVSIVEGDEAGLDSSKRNQDLEIDEDEGTESMTVAVPGRGFTKVTINTTKIQEKAQATRAVYEHAKAMGAAFGPYVQTCLDAFLPLVSFQYSSDVRGSAAQTLSAVFDSACAHGEQVGSMQLPQTYLPLLAQAISKQIAQEDPSDMEALYSLADSLSEIYYIVHRYNNSHPEILAAFSLEHHAQYSVQNCIQTMVACLERRSNMTRVLLGGQLTGEDEREEYLALLRSEQQLLTPLVDSVGYTLKFFRQDFLPLFERHVIPVLGPYLNSTKDVRASVSAVLLFDDCVEHCGPEAAAKYAPQLLPGILLALESEETDLVQAGVYGVTQIARQAPSAIMASSLPAIIHRLLALTSGSKADADNVYLMELAASALASLTLLGPFGGDNLKFVTRDTLMNAFLTQLPIQQDDDEAQICHAGLCHLLESGAIDLSKEAARITRIISEILSDVEEGEAVATPDTCERLTNILYQMQQQLPAHTMQQAFAALGPESQNAVSAALQEVSRSRSHVVTP